MLSKVEMRLKAKQMRREGMSIRAITAALGVAKGSVSTWVRDIQLTEAQIVQLKNNQRHFEGQMKGAQTNRANALQQRKAFQELGRQKARQGRPLHLMGCMLYWSEGAKHRNYLHFVNSDPNMLCIFTRFLREELFVSDDEFRLHIHCHTDNVSEHARIERYWLELLNLPSTALRKTCVKEGSKFHHTQHSNGLCAIRIHRTEVTQHIYGAIQEYGGFEKPEWLD